ncbi:acid resistance repetitive basic protein Asr [Pectobacterium brasiliense]|uniref:Acid shock protein n=1 Tax=Pectobacterium brasiliense TaxID=180957 RepID=A0AAE3BF25_9GAMM|nr:acid resistance repetitive basic protein Asr [Pectobacterium brasiliense]MBA0218653.1 acid resistance repetitive basic protein Asr [Pectobacterium brasiliense]MBN3052176.1 acid resistance repetitive basic protein Asr [Pectobacterium brasiliense]MBN3073782.1 acid resistance repetitive basic protein Asr [Pectobacterium brasiliense]MBN3171488.1 acid resistance repetitive basic protein Asr [Pectobacterium brasiliense]
MNKVLVMIAGAALGLSSVAFAADTVTTAPAQPTATTSAPAKAVHHKKQVKKAKPAAEQKAQAAKKHVKKAKPAPAQKAQAAKKHVKKAKPAPAQKAQAAKKHVKKAKTAKPATTTPAA